MLISFYEEFPTKENLEKLKLVEFKSEVFFAASSIDAFMKIKKDASKINPKVKASYWPILSKEEGYWISPFSKRRGILRVISELKRFPENLRVVWDVEPPIKRWHVLKNIFYAIKNKKIIDDFLHNAGKYNKEILITENVLFGSLSLGKMFGLYYHPKKISANKTLMYYTSMLRVEKLKKICLSRIKEEKKYCGKRLSIGLGTIATGMLGNEPKLTAKDLKRDLNDLKKMGIEEVIIFRLGGLNKEYVKVIKDYLTR